MRFYNLKSFLSFFLVIYLTGCANLQPMALSGTKPIDVSSESIGLIKIKISNKAKPTYQPNLMGVDFWKNNNPDLDFRFQPTNIFLTKEDKFKVYLISIKLKPGSYTLRGLLENYQSLFVHAMAYAPLQIENIIIKPNTVSYLGSIETTVRDKFDNEDTFSAGSVVPLLDQALAGFSYGTFDISVHDNFEEDIIIFKNTFPQLKNVAIQKNIMAQWHRDKAKSEF